MTSRLSSIVRMIRISRPRFWLYTFGTYLVGIIASMPEVSALTTLAVWVLGLYFLFPSNILIYGVNDIADYDTDKHNPKKEQYESLVETTEWRSIIWTIIISHIPFLVFFAWYDVRIVLGLGVHILLACIYSLPPIRAKARPFFDLIISASIYISAGVLGWLLVSSSTSFPLLAVLGGMAWAMGMQAYSALPDRDADTQAGIQTVATVLGERGTLFFTFMCYLISGIILGSLTHPFFGVLALPYVVLMIGLIIHPKRMKYYFTLYQKFPLINASLGMILFWGIILFRFF
jgi:lycopene elongase/hydratase (dihydrobisanhydrobacterioruberin-forming)